MDAGQMKNLRETFRDMKPDEMRKDVAATGIAGILQGIGAIP